MSDTFELTPKGVIADEDLMDTLERFARSHATGDGVPAIVFDVPGGRFAEVHAREQPQPV